LLLLERELEQESLTAAPTSASTRAACSPRKLLR
jgi:hypothetical protein